MSLISAVVLVDGLKTVGELQTEGLALKHVTLRGKIGKLMITQASDPTGFCMTTAQRQTFDQTNAQYYKHVDWALDVSQAEFQECDIRGVPAKLIRRDPETQVVVTRQKALEGRWRELDFGDSSVGVGIAFMLEREDPDVVLVAPKRGHMFRADMNAIHLLRDSGIAEPD